MRVNETIFFAVFKTNSSVHDRMEYWNCKKTYKDYMDWSNLHRGEIEKETGRTAVLDSFDIKFNSYINKQSC